MSTDEKEKNENMIWFFKISWTVVLFVILAIFGTAGLLLQNIVDYLYHGMMIVLTMIGVFFYKIRMDEGSGGRTTGAGLLAMLSLLHTMITLMCLRMLVHFELTKGLFLVFGVVMIAVIVINDIAIQLVERYRGSYMLITVIVMLTVAAGGLAYYRHEDKIAAKQEYAVVYSYIVSESDTPLHGMEQGEVWHMGEPKRAVDDAWSETVIAYLEAGEIVTPVSGNVNNDYWQKVQRQDGTIGYVSLDQVKPHEFMTRYEVEYAE